VAQTSVCELGIGQSKATANTKESLVIYHLTFVSWPFEEVVFGLRSSVLVLGFCLMTNNQMKNVK